MLVPGDLRTSRHRCRGTSVAGPTLGHTRSDGSPVPRVLRCVRCRIPRAVATRRATLGTSMDGSPFGPAVATTGSLAAGFASERRSDVGAAGVVRDPGFGSSL